MKFSGKMCFKIILKITKNQSFTLSLEDTFFEKPQGGRGEGGEAIKLIPPAVLVLIRYVEHKSEKHLSVAVSEKCYLVSAGPSFLFFYIQLSCKKIFI